MMYKYTPITAYSILIIASLLIRVVVSMKVCNTHKQCNRKWIVPHIYGLNAEAIEIEQEKRDGERERE